MVDKTNDNNNNNNSNKALQQRIEDLQLELQTTKHELELVRRRVEAAAAEENALSHKNAFAGVSHISPPPEKKGYLFQWQDRSIGWGGSKWSLTLTSLERGRISLYENHLAESPVSVLTLRDCAVQDEGRKQNKRHKSKHNPPAENEPGAYFHVFAIMARIDTESDDDDNDDITAFTFADHTSLPLLRFSTTSLADKQKWMDLISETCAYCDSEAFLADEMNRAAEKRRQEEEQARMATEMPGASRGTLPPLYFAPATTTTPHHNPHKMKRRRSSKSSSHKTMQRSSSYMSIAKSSLDADKKEAQYPPSKPMHTKAAPSFLSAEAPVQNYRGLFNLAMILLIVSNFRLIAVSLQQHGLALLNLRTYIDRYAHHYAEDPWHDFPLISGFLLLQGFIVAAYLIEFLLSRKQLSESLGMTLHHVNCHSILLVLTTIVWYQIESPAVGAFLLFYATITWMKLISYACANEDYRLAIKAGDVHAMEASLSLLSNLEQDEESIVYPQNITISNLYYFWLAPTLTYQIAFPKTPKVRLRRVFGIVLGLITCGTLATFLVAQIVSPTLAHLVLDLEKTGGVYTVGIMADYWLKLAIANTYLWLLMFYAYFHLYLNFWAEVLRFGDRVFYKDWYVTSCWL